MTAVSNTSTPDRPWRTRGELLAARAEAVPALERRLYSPGRIAGQALLTFVFAIAGPIVGTVLADQDRDAISIAVGSGVAVWAISAGVVAAVFAVRMGMENRRLMAELLAWEYAERAGRSLPCDDVHPVQRMPFDARHDPDFQTVARVISRAAYVRPRGIGLLARAGATGLGVALGLALSLMGFGAEPAYAATAGITGLLTLAGCLVAAAGLTRFGFRLTRIWARLDADLRELNAPGMPPAMSPARLTFRVVLALGPFLALVINRLNQS